MTQENKQKLEAIIRANVESMPSKYRDARGMFYHGIKPYKDLSEEEIDETFEELELEITQDDIEWASYQESNK